MATYLENLIARRDAVAQELADLDHTKKGGGINISGAGTEADHHGYRTLLLEELAKLEELIDKAQEEDGPSGRAWEENIDVESF